MNEVDIYKAKKEAEEKTIEIFKNKDIKRKNRKTLFLFSITFLLLIILNYVFLYYLDEVYSVVSSFFFTYRKILILFLIGLLIPIAVFIFLKRRNIKVIFTSEENKIVRNYSTFNFIYCFTLLIDFLFQSVIENDISDIKGLVFISLFFSILFITCLFIALKHFLTEHFTTEKNKLMEIDDCIKNEFGKGTVFNNKPIFLNNIFDDRVSNFVYSLLYLFSYSNNDFQFYLISGEWGSGKTSLVMTAIKQSLIYKDKQHKTEFIYIDLKEYQDSKSLYIGILEILVSKIDYIFTFKEKRIIKGLLNKALSSYTKGFPIFNNDNDYDLKTIKNKVEQYLIINKIKLNIIFDDLDRLGYSLIVDFFKFINILEIENVHVFLLNNSEVIKDAFTENKISENYIQKIVTATINVPKFDESLINKYLLGFKKNFRYKQNFFFKKISDSFLTKKCWLKNPRQAISLFNYIIANCQNSVFIDEKCCPEIIFMLCVIKIRYISFYFYLNQNKFTIIEKIKSNNFIDLKREFDNYNLDSDFLESFVYIAYPCLNNEIYPNKNVYPVYASLENKDFVNKYFDFEFKQENDEISVKSSEK